MGVVHDFVSIRFARVPGPCCLRRALLASSCRHEVLRVSSQLSAALVGLGDMALFLPFTRHGVLLPPILAGTYPHHGLGYPVIQRWR